MTHEPRQAPHRPGTAARLALESTLLVHGVPREGALALAGELEAVALQHGARPVLVGVVDGQMVLGLSGEQLAAMLALPGGVAKLNTSGLGAALSQGRSGATTVSTTVELAHGAGIRVFATGGVGGVHRNLGQGPGQRLDVSADLLAVARFPVAVVTAGCKSILDIAGTREVLETLGVPVIGWRTDRFPAFYQRDGGEGVDARFDDLGELARFVRRELARTCRGVVVCNPIPPEHELGQADWARWLAIAQARAEASGLTGRDVTPAVLAALHQVSDGATLKANIELVKHNVRVGAQLAKLIEA